MEVQKTLTMPLKLVLLLNLSLMLIWDLDASAQDYIQEKAIDITPSEKFKENIFSVEKFPILEAPVIKSNWRNINIVQQPSRPLEPLPPLENKLKETNCNLLPSKCNEIKTVIKNITSGNSAAPDCSFAANEYLKYYKSKYDWTPPGNVIRSYDIACLESVVPRITDTLIKSNLPLIFASGGTSPDAEGMINAVALLEVDEKPVCGGLLRNDYIFLTAAHCYLDYKSQIDAGRTKIRPISGTKGPWKIALKKPFEVNANSRKVVNDWIAFSILTSETIGATETLLKQATLQSVSLVGIYGGFEEINYLTLSSGANWQKSLRIPKSGLCNVIEVNDGCILLSCQTVPGFSGTPIFSSDFDTKSPLSVVGFISQQNSATSGCITNIKGGTLAVSANSIGLF